MRNCPSCRTSNDWRHFVASAVDQVKRRNCIRRGGANNSPWEKFIFNADKAECRLRDNTRILQMLRLVSMRAAALLSRRVFALRHTDLF
jgi:hypothetical protein